MLQLSVIVLSYNTTSVTKQCLESLVKSLSQSKDLGFEIIVVDNASVDSSQKMLVEFQSRQTADFKLILNKKNLGYPKGNNQAIKKARGAYVLFLNSDTLLTNVDFESLIKYLDKNKDIGVLTVKVKLPTEKIDPASHRGFPTIWNSFCYFLGIEKLFEKTPLLGKYFGGYHLTHLDLNTTHEIDSPTGAFYLTRKHILDKVKGFDDKNFFFYGEDLDLSYRIKNLGYKIIYYPLYEILHLKHTSGLKKQDSAIRKKSKRYFFDAMRIFYRKHYENTHPWFVNKVVYFFIDLKERIS